MGHVVYKGFSQTEGHEICLNRPSPSDVFIQVRKYKDGQDGDGEVVTAFNLGDVIRETIEDFGSLNGYLVGSEYDQRLFRRIAGHLRSLAMCLDAASDGPWFVNPEDRKRDAEAFDKIRKEIEEDK